MTISAMNGVLCCGNICRDIPVWPVSQFEWGKTTWVEKIAESVGGNGATTSYALARLGVPVALTGFVGSDPPGGKLLRALQASGVNVDRVGRSELPTTSSICLVHPSGDRALLHLPGASTALRGDHVCFDSPGFNHFHLANPFSLPQVRASAGELMQRAKAAGLTTSLDSGWDAKGRWLEDLGPCLANTDLLFVNESEARMLSGCKGAAAAADYLQARGAGAVVVKLGRAGCFLRGAIVPGFVVEAVDTTGAGDCFSGGFLAALHRGWHYPEAARFANAVAALKVQCLGAAQGLRAFEDTLAWIREVGSQ